MHPNGCEVTAAGILRPALCLSEDNVSKTPPFLLFVGAFASLDQINVLM